jgi:colanic acid/amylovoran biosynthesis protein
MLIEIRQAGFINKGAELMLHAVLQKTREAWPDAGFVMVPTRNKGPAPYLKRAELGFLQKAWLRCCGLQCGGLAALLPRKVREMYGIVLDREVDVVLDAAGFAYGDQWSLRASRELARSCRRWRRRGARVVLLPQALGPFTSPEIKKLFNTVADNADLIFARDPVSYRYLTEAVGERPNVRMAPDFTNLVEGVVPAGFPADSRRFCLVPNFRMIDKTEGAVSAAYVPFMIKCARYLVEKDAAPFLLVHEGGRDLQLARQIAEGADGRIPIVQEGHPLKIKGILGACEATLGSRFHGLVSALSQGVPSLATGWSHKYEMLFRDYGFDDGLMDVLADDATIRAKLDLIVAPDSRAAIRAVIAQKAVTLKKRSQQMWSDVFTELGADRADSLDG